VQVPPRAVHIGIGDGPLCLGLTAPAAASAGFEVHLVGSPGRDHPPVYQRTVYRRDGYTKTYDQPVASYTGPADEEMPSEIAKALPGTGVVLITASLRGGISKRSNLIADIVSRCPSEAEVAFVACENTVTPAHEALIETLERRGVHCPPTIIDRVCTWPEEERPHPARVIHHEVGEWILPAPSNGSALVATLGLADEVTFVPASELEAYEHRKIWLVNGVHLVLAASASLRNPVGREQSISDALDSPRTLKAIQELGGGMADALLAEHGLEVPAEWSLDRMRAVFQLPDRWRRILKPLRRRDPIPFIESFEQRLAAPARILHANEKPVEPFLRAATIVGGLLLDGSHYSDWNEIRDGELTEEADADTLRAYERALEGWVPQGRIDEKVALLDEAFAGHRDDRQESVVRNAGL